MIELLVVTGVFLFLATSSAVVYSRFLAQSSAAATRDQILTDLRTAQFYSMTGRFGDSWGVRYAPGTLTLFRGGSYAARVPELDLIYHINGNVTVAGLDEIVFARGLGTPSVAGTIVVNGSGSSYRLTIDQNGVVNQ